MTYFTTQIIQITELGLQTLRILKNLKESLHTLPVYLLQFKILDVFQKILCIFTLGFDKSSPQISEFREESLRILENPWESLRILEKCAKFRWLCLEILVIQRIPKNPRPLMPSSINDHGRVDCVKHTFTLWAALIRNLSTKAVKMFMMRSSLTPSISSCLIRSL